MPLFFVFCLRLDLIGFPGINGDRQSLAEVNGSELRIQAHQAGKDGPLGRKTNTEKKGTARDSAHFRRSRRKGFRLFAGRNKDNGTAGIPGNGADKSGNRGNRNQNIMFIRRGGNARPAARGTEEKRKCSPKCEKKERFPQGDKTHREDLK